MTASSPDDVANLKRKNEELTQELSQARAELSEAHRGEAATADVLKVISRSAFDLRAVLDTIASTASGLCAGADTSILLREGEDLRNVAHHGSVLSDKRTAVGSRRPIGRGWVAGRTVVDRRASTGRASG
jgi:two-component system, NtrC family, sensor kinase